MRINISFDISKREELTAQNLLKKLERLCTVGNPTLSKTEISYILNIQKEKIDAVYNLLAENKEFVAFHIKNTIPKIKPKMKKELPTEEKATLIKELKAKMGKKLITLRIEKEEEK